MKPYYDDGKGIVIFNADCREILPSIKADAMITDPVWPNASVPLFGSDDPEGMFFEAWRKTPDFKRAAIHLGCDTPPFFLKCVDLPFFRVVSLELVRVGYKGRLLQTGDIAYLFGEPPPSIPGQHVIPGRYIDTSSDGKQSDHPSPRKLNHVRWLVKWWTAEGDSIVDPFMGSGTTLIAAKEFGRPCIGIEVERKHCDEAIRRLAQEVLL